MPLDSLRKHTHMMDGLLCVEMFEKVHTQAFRFKRSKLGIDALTRGMIIHDAFTGHSSDKSGEATLRDRWAESMNIEMFDRVPGGKFTFLPHTGNMFVLDPYTYIHTIHMLPH